MLRNLLWRISHEPLPEGKKAAFRNYTTHHTVSDACVEWLVTRLLGLINALLSRAARKSLPPLSLLNDRSL